MEPTRSLIHTASIVTATLTLLSANVALALPLSAIADGYLFAPVDVPGAERTAVTGINNAGVLVGGFVAPTNNTTVNDFPAEYAGITPGGFPDSNEGFILADGTYKGVFTPAPPSIPGAIAPPPCFDCSIGTSGRNDYPSIVSAISNTGQLALTYNPGGLVVYTGVAPFDCHPQALVGGAGGCLAHLEGGARELSGLGINSAGQVVGAVDEGLSQANAFLFTPGSGFTTFNLGGGTIATAINDHGDVVGYSNVFGGCGINTECRGFVMSGGVLNSVSDPASDETMPFGINNSGVIVGRIGTEPHGFVDNAGTFTQIDVPFANTDDTVLTGINDSGEIVGVYQKVGQNGYFGFVATPLGLSQEDPLVSTITDLQHRFVFQNVVSGSWVDPIMASAFTYQMIGSSLFTGISDLPTGFLNPFTISAPDCTLPGTFAGGQSVDFLSVCGHGLAQFTVSGIDPSVDVTSTAGFPIELAFDSPTASFTVDPVSSIPEPATLTLLATAATLTLLATALVGIFGHRRCQPGIPALKRFGDGRRNLATAGDDEMPERQPRRLDQPGS